MKLYELSHLHVLNDFCVSDQKKIGTYTNISLAKSALEMVKNQLWFIDFPDGFSIEEYVVDAPLLYVEWFNKDEWVYFQKVPQINTIWRLEFFRAYPQDDFYDEIRVIGMFSSRKNAMKVKKFLVDKPWYREYKRWFFIWKCLLDRTFWEEGFVSV